MQGRRHRKRGFDPRVGKIPWRRKWQPTVSILAWRIPWTEEPGGLRSCPKGREERDTPEHAFFKGLGLGEGWFGVENGLGLGLSMHVLMLWNGDSIRFGSGIRALDFGSGEDGDAVETKMEFRYGGAWD